MACKSTSPAARPQPLPDAACSSEPKPRTHEVCLLKRCYKHKKLQWLVSSWSQVGAPAAGPLGTRSTSRPSRLSLLPAPLPPGWVLRSGHPPGLQAPLRGILGAFHSRPSSCSPSGTHDPTAHPILRPGRVGALVRRRGPGGPVNAGAA